MAGKSFSIREETLVKFKEKCKEIREKESHIVNRLIELWLETDGEVLNTPFTAVKEREEEAVKEEAIIEVEDEQPTEKVIEIEFNEEKHLCPRCKAEWNGQVCEKCGFIWGM